jgi:hypothetical protein
MNLIDIPASLRDYFEQTPDGKPHLRGARVSIGQILEPHLGVSMRIAYGTLM